MGYDRGMLDIEKILKHLVKKRPVFHAEADFQHALAWEIQTHYPSAKIRLEIHPNRVGKREYLDILVVNRNKIYAIELKYKTRNINMTHDGEKFYLLNQGAKDTGRYDFIKDIVRLKGFVSCTKNAVGYAILLTNDYHYWQSAIHSDTVDANFRIGEDRKKLTGQLKWSKKTSAGTIKGRENLLDLGKYSYPINWQNYSNFPTKGPNQFRYLLIKVN